MMAEKNKNNKDSQTGQVTPKKYLKKEFIANLCNVFSRIDIC
jgi:hypothetical protein